jgi:V-type H+-transporting ATPase subunit E
MRKLGERTAVVRCRQSDVMLVKEVMEPARKAYTSLYGEEAPSLTLDSRDYLAPGPQGNADDVEGLTW